MPVGRVENFKEGEEKKISRFIREVYDEFVAPDYPESGNEFFYAFIQPKKILNRVKDGTDVIFTIKRDPLPAHAKIVFYQINKSSTL